MIYKCHTTIEVNDIIKRYQTSMRFFVINRMGYNDTIAEDIYQDALIKIFVGLRDGKYNPDRGAVSTWMYKVCTNQIIDYMRRLHRNPAFPNAHVFDDEMIEDDFHFRNEINQILVNQRIDLQDREYKELNDTQFYIIEQYIGKIKNNKCREALYNRIVLGYKYRKIAKRMKLPEGSIKGNINRAKTFLQELMVEDGLIAA